MSYGSTAYESFVRIHIESGETRQPSWTALPHLGRLAWEAAAQAVAMAVLPASLNPEPLEECEENDEENDEDDDNLDARLTNLSESPDQFSSSP